MLIIMMMMVIIIIMGTGSGFAFACEKICTKRTVLKVDSSQDRKIYC